MLTLHARHVYEYVCTCACACACACTCVVRARVRVRARARVRVRVRVCAAFSLTFELCLLYELVLAVLVFMRAFWSCGVSVSCISFGHCALRLARVRLTRAESERVRGVLA